MYSAPVPFLGTVWLEIKLILADSSNHYPNPIWIYIDIYSGRLCKVGSLFRTYFYSIHEAHRPPYQRPSRNI